VGNKTENVKKDSSQLFWPRERRIPVRANHTDMVKFMSQVDDTYSRVVTYMGKMMDAIIDTRGMNQFILHPEALVSNQILQKNDRMLLTMLVCNRFQLKSN
jgi:hypothetical protein